MNTELLKKKILDLAIKGKLVEQRPEDGTAEDLFQQIQEDKQKLIEEGKLKKEKPLAPIADVETPFEIPKSWKWIKLGNLCSISRGASPRPIKSFITDDKNGVNWIKIGDTSEKSKFINSCKEKITQDGALKSRYVHAGDFLLTNSMSFGHPYILNIDGCVHDGWLILSDYSAYFDKIFLYYLLSSPFAYLQFYSLASGTTVKNLNSDKVANSVFPLPPLAEQKRIAEKIDSLFSRISCIENDLFDVDKLSVLTRKKILELAIKGRLVEQRPEDGTAEDLYQQIQEEKAKLIKEGKLNKEEHLPPIDTDNIPFDIPESWMWVKLNDVVSKNIKRGKSPKYVEKSGVLVFAQKCNSKYDGIRLDLALHLDESKLDKYSETEFMKDKDTVINSTGGGTMGRVGIYQVKDNPENIPLVPDSHVTIIRSCNLVDGKYIYFYLKTQQPKLEKLGDGSTNQTELRPDTLKQLYFPLPPLAEQKRIVAKVEELLALCDKLKLK